MPHKHKELGIVELGSLPDVVLFIPARDIARGYTLMDCLECRGTGWFEITQRDGQVCNACKGTGRVYVNC